jgi:hypothetical protein
MIPLQVADAKSEWEAHRKQARQSFSSVSRWWIEMNRRASARIDPPAADASAHSS